MTISHELNSEIIAALLAAKGRSQRELEDLKDTLLSVHSTLQGLSEKNLDGEFPAPVARKASAGSSQQ